SYRKSIGSSIYRVENGNQCITFASFAHLHAVVIRATAAFRWHPGDDLIWVLNVAGFAVDAVGWVQTDALAVRRGRVVQHFVNVGRAEILAGAGKLFQATIVADVSVFNQQMSGLIVFVLRAGMVEVGELVEGELTIAFGGAEQVGLGASVGRQFGDWL